MLDTIFMSGKGKTYGNALCKVLQTSAKASEISWEGWICSKPGEDYNMENNEIWRRREKVVSVTYF